MAADLHIHVLDGVTVETVQRMMSHSYGSKYFNLRACSEVDRQHAVGLVANTPQCWVGEVSWLKAMVTGDSETFVPGPVQAVQNAIGEDLPELDEQLEQKIVDAMKLENSTDYRLALPEVVASFLRSHRGKRIFCVSW